MATMWVKRRKSAGFTCRALSPEMSTPCRRAVACALVDYNSGLVLGKAGIKTLDDLADLATDELIAKKRTEQRRRDGTVNRRAGRDEDKGGVLKINEKLKLVPGHCDPTCNVHDWYVGVRNGKVEALWPVSARGKAY